MPEVKSTDALERAWAERDDALIKLQQLERMISRVGGHMTPEDQETLRGARAVLAQHGRYKSDGLIAAVTPSWALDIKRRS